VLPTRPEEEEVEPSTSSTMSVEQEPEDWSAARSMSRKLTEI